MTRFIACPPKGHGTLSWNNEYISDMLHAYTIRIFYIFAFCICIRSFGDDVSDEEKSEVLVSEVNEKRGPTNVINKYFNRFHFKMTLLIMF